MTVIFEEIRSRREVREGDGAVVHDLNEEGTRRARGVGVCEDASLSLSLFLSLFSSFSLSAENRKGKRGEVEG